MSPSAETIHDRKSEPPGTELRSILGRFCTGVTVITAHDGDRPHGFACQSFVSLSLDPPYVSFSPARSSTSWPRLRAARELCINVLAHDQGALCRGFAVSGADKFDGVEWSPGENGAPTLAGSLVHVEATVETEHDAGDHTIVIARVTRLEAPRDDLPLLFFRGEFGQLTGTDQNP